MQESLRRKPSASMVVAILALVVAASGTAIAAGGASSGDKLIKKRSLSGNRLRNHTITGKQVNFRRLGKVPRARNADHATTAGSASISRVDYESVTAPMTPANTNVSRTVHCPSGLNAVGGGTKVTHPGANEYIRDTYPVGRTGWQGNARSNVTTDAMTVYVICAPAAKTTP